MCGQQLAVLQLPRRAGQLGQLEPIQLILETRDNQSAVLCISLFWSTSFRLRRVASVGVGVPPPAPPCYASSPGRDLRGGGALKK